jgi:uncharacterized glyoxalase superfamily protein PhnB
MSVPEGYTRINAYMLYADCNAAIAFLTEVFGFEEETSERYCADDGTTILHTAMVHGGERVMLGHPGGDYTGPNARGGPTVHVYCYVDDVDAHHARAVAAGAEIVQALQDAHYGDRRYGARDPEGHEWWFATCT